MKRLTACLVGLAACGGGKAAQPADPAPAAKLDVTSTAFAPDGSIPTEHTCEGADTAPPLAWSAPPAGTKSVAVIVDDPDAPDPKAPQRTWVHWVVVNLPATATSVPPGAVMGTNDFGKTAWGGPCPPIGRHRYFFKVYALDAQLGEPGITKQKLLEQMQGHVLAKGELVGTYQKTK